MNTGLAVEKPKNVCNDKHCPFHTGLPLRGRTFTGTVVTSGLSKTAKITFPNYRYIPKYERYERRFTQLHVHNPPCINAKVGDRVKVAETRKISKTKTFVIIQHEITSSEDRT